MRPRVLIAFGGNALLRPEDRGTPEEQRAHAREAAAALAKLAEGWGGMLVVHGNGPQVGQNLLRVEEAVTKVPPQGLDLCVAETQGSMGSILGLALGEALGERRPDGVACLLTHVVVDAGDPAFRNPAKPIGPFYTEYRARQLMEQEGWAMVEDAGRGYRKVVASPRPLRVLEAAWVARLLAMGAVVIAGGGGGIPVVEEDGRLRTVEAVIDKDRTALLLAAQSRVDIFVLLTQVPCLYRDFGTETQAPLRRLKASQAREMARDGQFPPGSMGPKVEAVLGYLEAVPGGRALITDAAHLEAAFASRAGTWILPDDASGEDVPCTADRWSTTTT